MRLPGHMPGAENSTNWVLLSAQQTLEGVILITILQAGLGETGSLGHCDGRIGTQTQAEYVRMRVCVSECVCMCVCVCPQGPSPEPKAISFSPDQEKEQERGSNPFESTSVGTEMPLLGKEATWLHSGVSSIAQQTRPWVAGSMVASRPRQAHQAGRG